MEPILTWDALKSLQGCWQVENETKSFEIYEMRVININGFKDSFGSDKNAFFELRSHNKKLQIACGDIFGASWVEITSLTETSFTTLTFPVNIVNHNAKEASPHEIKTKYIKIPKPDVLPDDQ